MGKTKHSFILERERSIYEENDCDGNCLECIKSCPTTQRDIEEYVEIMNEDIDYE